MHGLRRDAIARIHRRPAHGWEKYIRKCGPVERGVARVELNRDDSFVAELTAGESSLEQFEGSDERVMDTDNEFIVDVQPSGNRMEMLAGERATVVRSRSDRDTTKATSAPRLHGENIIVSFFEILFNFTRYLVRCGSRLSVRYLSC